MSTLQITYAGHVLTDTGVTQYGHGMQSDGRGSVPRRLNETFRLKHRFFETSFADNEARWSTLKAHLRTHPRGQLVITDERGRVIENRQCKFGGIDGGEEWGQYRREVSLTFDAIGGVLLVSEQCAAFTPTGRTQIVLPNVESMTGGIKTDRPTTQVALRREQMESVSMSGKWTPDPELTLEQRRDALLAKKAEIEGIAGAPDGVLTYGAFSKTMQIESVNADLGDVAEELTWTLSAIRRVFPDGEYAEMDYEAAFSEDREDNTRTLTLSGKVIADTKAHAETTAVALKTAFAAGRQFLGQEIRNRGLKGTDGETDNVEISFTFRFKESFGAIVSYKLKVATGYDARAGDITTVWSGSVTAETAAAALTTARELGSGKEDGTLYLMNSSEDVNTVSVEDVAIGNTVEFSYTYLGKSPIEFAEVSYDSTTEFFGGNAFTVAGTCTAATNAAALAFARLFKVTGLLERSIRETPGEMQKGNGTGAKLGWTHAVRLDFSYTYAKDAVRNTVSYGREIANDFDARKTAITISGTAYGPSETTCGATIDAVAAVSLFGARRLRMQRTPNYDFDRTSNTSVLNSVSFSESWEAPLQVSDGADILEARYSISRNYGVWKAQIDEIPQAAPYVQENVTRSCGTITVSGSITVVSTGEAVARSWARDKKSYCTGYTDQVEEVPDYSFHARSGTSVRAITLGFTYASRDPNLYATF